jgi:TRAP-type C4-dicarboxylate transport system substrate-binding protein
VVNLDTWDDLTDAQKDVLKKAAFYVEDLCDEDRQQSAEELKRQEEAGIEVIEFTGKEGEAYLDQAYEAGWNEFVEANPEHGPRIRELLSE